MFRAVILDFDGTLNTSERYYEAFVKAYLEVLVERLGCSLDEAKRMVEDVKEEALSLTKAVKVLGIPPVEFYREIAEKLDVKCLLNEDPSIKDIIRSIRGMGLKVAMLTNSGRSLLKKALEAMGCPLEDFDLVVTSDDVEPKPSLEPFIYTVKLLGIRPEEVVYVGDRVLSELKPAKQVGMWTIRVDRGTGCLKSPWVDWTARSIHRLPELLKDTRLQEPL